MATMKLKKGVNGESWHAILRIAPFAPRSVTQRVEDDGRVAARKRDGRAGCYVLAEFTDHLVAAAARDRGPWLSSTRSLPF